MGKDQNAKGGLVCAHPPLALSTVIAHFQAPPSFFFLGRDPNPAPEN
jgi:hypothetical protein